jgi:hypothetical protein
LIASGAESAARRMQGIYKKRARRARRKAILMEFEAEMGAISFETRRIGGLLRRSFA